MTVKSSMQYKWRNKTESGTRIEDIFDCPDPDALAPAILASSTKPIVFIGMANPPPPADAYARSAADVLPWFEV